MLHRDSFPARSARPLRRPLRRPLGHNPVCDCRACAISCAEPLETLELESTGWEGEVNRSSGEYVRWFQAALNRIAGAGLVVDGISGSLTKAAVRSFQSRHGLSADGIVGPLTEAALVAAGAGGPPGSGSSTPPHAPAPAPAPAPSTGASPRLRVPESDLIALLPVFARYAYNNPEPRYPWLPTGLSSEFLAPPYQTNCCCFVEALLWRAWANRHGSAFQWNSQRHGQAVIVDSSNLYSSVDVHVQTGIASALPSGALPTSWCVAQGWTRGGSGHSFIVVARHAATDRVLTLEANGSSSLKLSGVGCRNFGNLRDLPGGRPPARWWESSAAPRWADIARYYDAGVKLARLGVTGANWSGLPA